MNDEGVGLAGWLMADLVLVLAFIFLAMVPGREALVGEALVGEALVVEAPSIIAIDCTPTEPAVTELVMCSPRVKGEKPFTYSWTVSGHGTPISERDESSFKAKFSAVGAITLVASNEKGGASPPFTLVVDPLECTLITDFHFDQIVLTNIALGKVSWTDISTGRVSIDLSKDQEDENLNQRSELNWSDHKVSEYLRRQQKDGFQIALVETFAHSRIDDMHRPLAKQINEAFFTGLDTRTSLPNVEIFVDPEEALGKWFAAYRDESFPPGTARINLYFVSGNCTDGN
jgi:hypothetical protein